MRCFIACFLMPDCARRLRRVLRSCWQAPPGVSLVPVANYHLTLRFLGEQDAAGESGIAAAVAGLGAGPVRVEVVGVGGFPAPERANVVFAELAPQQDVQRWYTLLESLPGPSAPGWFVPHVTLARSGKSLVVPRLAELEGMMLNLAPPALYESVPDAGGVRYRLIEFDSGGIG